MKVRVLGAHGSEGLGCRPSSFLVDGRVLVDAGSVGGAIGIEEQMAIEHALISHSHLDHVAGLGFLSEMLALAGTPRPITVASIAPVLAALRSSCFNSVVWTDFSAIPSPEAPAVRYRELPENVESEVGHLRVLPVAVNHTVPTAGYVVHDGRSGFV